MGSSLLLESCFCLLASCAQRNRFFFGFVLVACLRCVCLLLFPMKEKMFFIMQFKISPLNLVAKLLIEELDTKQKNRLKKQNLIHKTYTIILI